jgi:GTP-binding protein HflX
VESFKSTLDEVREADILLHVVDISHPQFEEHIRVVDQTLVELKAADKPVLMVFNKIDAFRHTERDPDDLSEPGPEHITLEELKRTWMAKTRHAVFISASRKENIAELRNMMISMVKEIHMKRYPNATASSDYNE